MANRIQRVVVDWDVSHWGTTRISIRTYIILKIYIYIYIYIYINDLWMMKKWCMNVHMLMGLVFRLNINQFNYINNIYQITA